jgi:S-formylglutathione hydrolase FrmB
MAFFFTSKRSCPGEKTGRRSATSGRRRERRETTTRLSLVERLEPRSVPSAAAIALAPPPAVTGLGGFADQAVTAAAARAVAVPTANVAAARGGLITQTIASPFQRTATRLRVLLPDSYDPTRTYRTVYVLPVEPGNAAAYGDGLTTIRQANLHNLHDTVFVAPSFSAMPWYADHATNIRLRQESHLIRTVIPFVEARYAVERTAAGRLLLGFSKSGYGAVSMLLRRPDLFGRALAWDSPLAMANPATGYGFLGILGTRANFAANYQITTLLRRQASQLVGGPPRIYLGGWGYQFTRQDHATVSRLMTQLQIPHVYDVGRQRAHVWNSGWMPGAVGQLLG